MEINMKKCLLAIILVLFILSSCLFLTCLDTFASENILSNYYISDDTYNSLTSIYPSHCYVQPGGKLSLNIHSREGATEYDPRIVLFESKNSSQSGYTFRRHIISTDEIRVENRDFITPTSSSFGGSTFFQITVPDGDRIVDWAEFEFESDYPVLVFFRDMSVNASGSEGITFTFYDLEFGVEVDLTKSSFAPETYGSVVGRVYGSYLEPFGTVEVDLYKENLTTGTSELIYEKLFSISTLYSDFTFNFDCPPLEIGSYHFHAKYIIDDEIKYEDTEPFELDGTTKSYEDVIIRDGESYHVDVDYFNKIFQIVKPEHYNLYNSDIYFEIYAPLAQNGGYSTYNKLFGNFAYSDSFEIQDTLSDLLGQQFNRRIDVYLNGVLIKEYDFKHVGITKGYLPAALLNRGKNTLFVVSSQGLESESSEFFNWLAPDGTYRYIHSSVEFFYKTKEGSGGLIVEEDDGRISGGRDHTLPGGGSSDMPNDGSSGRGGGSSNNGYIEFTGLGTPPDRSNYSDDIFGTIGYALDFIIYLLSMPFKVLFGGLEWLITNFLTLFSWVGQLASIIGSWFNFLPREVRSLLLGGFMCSIIAFVLKLFRK